MPAKKEVRPTLDFRYQASVTIGAVVGTIGTVSIPLHSDSWFIVHKLIAVSAGDFKTVILDTGTGQSWDSAAVRQNNLWGTIQLPNRLIDKVYLAPSAALNFTLTNNIAGANAVQLVIEGEKWLDLKKPPVDVAKRRPQWFQYIGDFAALAANATTILQIPISADADFLVRKLTAVSTGNFQVRLSNSDSAVGWSADFIQQANQFGVIQYPNVLPKSRLIRRNSTIQVELTDLSGNPNTIQLNFEGVKLFK